MRIENPRSEHQIIEDSLWPVGEYSFEIASAKDDVSKKGNEMIVLNINVYSDDGRCMAIYDYLLASMELKLRRCVDVCGLSAKYEAGKVEAEDFVNKTGFLILGKQEASGEYPAKNAVKSYVFPKAGAVPRVAAKQIEIAEGLDDEVPF